MTVAAIDCGTNAIRLLIADQAPDGSLVDRVRLMRTVRLGEGVDRTGEFAPAALDRTFAAVDEYAELIADHRAEQVRFVATSASRDVSNRNAFITGVRKRLGIEPEVITGEEEAALSFAGAVRGLPPALVRRPTLVVDIGGGSTEFVLGEWAPAQSTSVDIGCVRMTERHLLSDPPTPMEVAQTWADIRTAIATAGAVVDLAAASSFIGLAGTVTTVAAMALDLPEYDASILHGSVVGYDEVADVTRRLLEMTRAQRAALPFMHPGRADVIGGGAMILTESMRAAGADSVVVSETDILDGIAYRLFELSGGISMQPFM
jgi:exopolyphosphatase / guanosine-5'-triphosphate,3'-diphosphate pyrophosphatase